MSDPSTTAPTQASELERQPETDWTLSILIDVLNESGADIAIPVTASVGGTLITGGLVPGRLWFQKLRAARTGGETSIGKMLGVYFDLVDKRYEAVLKTESSITAFAHVVDATVFEPTGTKIARDFWRIRLASIDAFTIGSLTGLDV